MDSTSYLSLTGRLLIGLPLAMSGLGKLAAYGPTTAMIAAVGLPVPTLAYAVAVALELGGGLLLIAGYKAPGTVDFTDALPLSTVGKDVYTPCQVIPY